MCRQCHSPPPGWQQRSHLQGGAAAASSAQANGEVQALQHADLAHVYACSLISRTLSRCWRVAAGTAAAAGAGAQQWSASLALRGLTSVGVLKAGGQRQQRRKRGVVCILPAQGQGLGPNHICKQQGGQEPPEMTSDWQWWPPSCTVGVGARPMRYSSAQS